MGASVFSLWTMLSKDFMILITIAAIIAIPIASYMMNRWLEKYQYKTEMVWWIFAASGFGAIAITLVTISYQAIKAALANPVKNLRSE